jgi:hypothetical protein
MRGLKSLSFALPLCVGLASSGAFAQGLNLGGLSPHIPLPRAGAADNHGHFVCTAAITANGGVFSGEYVNDALTSRLSPGTYQVAFKAPCPNVQIANGWFRIAQPDTLGTGSLPARSCIVADRAGVPSAIWVQCFNQAGAVTDTPFTLHVSR